MPKSRNSGSIGSRQGDITYDEREMSDRIEDRLRAAGTVRVNVESRTRGTREDVDVTFSGRTAVIRSGSGRSYSVDINTGSCDCPDFVNRQNRCRHIEAADIAREQITQGTFQGSRNDTDINTNQFTGEYISNETEDEIRNLQREYHDDSFFYTENPEQFEQDMQRLREAPVPYYYQNVLNGSNVTFGIELEFVDGDSNAIARELHSLGICSSSSMQRYHSLRAPGKWVLEIDGSVTRGGRGGELISPVLTDTPETWQQIETICEVARRHGARVNTSTGGHVHIGAEDALDGKRQRWRRFFKTAVGFEEAFHRLAGGEQSRFRNSYYAPSSLSQNRAGISTRMPQEENTSAFQTVISRISQGKYQSINISSFSGSKKTIEFRAFNGTLTPGIIQANVKYAAGVINTSVRSRIRQGEGIDVSDSDRKRGRIINDYEINNNRSDLSIMKAMDVMFSRKEDKEHILSVMAKNSWV
ncbi:MAG: amidoligase family protein [Eubacteriales bacterium]|nr:amidoligase family protein [Eubacteriales bacterium]